MTAEKLELKVKTLSPNFLKPLLLDFPSSYLYPLGSFLPNFFVAFLSNSSPIPVAIPALFLYLLNLSLVIAAVPPTPKRQELSLNINSSMKKLKLKNCYYLGI